jgi:hypothetical protein
LAIALAELFVKDDRPKGPSERPIDAYFTSPGGPIALTLACTPPAQAELEAETKQRLEFFFDAYAKFGKNLNLALLIAYLPCKERVLHGRMTFTRTAEARLRDWKPTDLPEVIAGYCARYGVSFLDLTPAFVQDIAASGPLAYNALYDSHLTARGSETVARALAGHLRDARDTGDR